jgi:enamine deaminase RidA (YjgF/YER057c/UK114 family)
MNERRTSVSSGSPFEPQLGFCRAVRVGNIIAISGTAPLSSEGRTVGIGDAAAQARRCLEIVADALERALFAMILGECLKPETGWRSEVNSNCRYRFLNNQTTT